MYNFQQAELCYMTQGRRLLKQIARFINETNVIEISELLQKARRDIGQNANGENSIFRFGTANDCFINLENNNSYGL